MIRKNEVATALIGNELVYGMITRRHAKAEYAAEKAEVFASAFAVWAEGKDADYCAAALKFYAIEFGNHFRPGFTLTPEYLIAKIEEVLPLVVAAVPAPVAEVVEPVVEEVEVPEVEEAEETEILDVEEAEVPEKWEGDAEIEKEEPSEGSELHRDIKVADLEVLHKSAVRAYIKEGLETIGDLLDYDAIAGLESVSGVGKEWAEDTRKLIQHIAE
jgi:hypothetical protein